MTLADPNPEEQVVASGATLPYNPGVFVFLLVAGILTVILLWGLLLWWVLRQVFARLSGWNDLARRYPAARTPAAWRWRNQTVKVGLIRYRRAMRVAALPDGLYLAESGLLRHPPLRIPWREIGPGTPATVYGRPFIAVAVGVPPVGTLEFPAELYRALAPPASVG